MSLEHPGKGLVAVNNNIDAAHGGAPGNRVNSSAQVVGRQRFKAVNFYPWPEYMTSAGLGSAAMKGARDEKQTIMAPHAWLKAHP